MDIIGIWLCGLGGAGLIWLGLHKRGQSAKIRGLPFIEGLFEGLFYSFAGYIWFLVLSDYAKLVI